MNDPGDDAACYEASARSAAMEARNAIPSILREIEEIKTDIRQLRNTLERLVETRGENSGD